MTGPLEGLRVVELASIGPGPHAAMMLADLGADTIRVVRPDLDPPTHDIMLRNRRRVTADLKTPAGVADVLDLTTHADVLIEGMRPGVAERLGVGPEECRGRNHGLVYARMTGWGQHGPLAERAGHDINYIGLTGVLDAIGPAGGHPVPPLNLIGDYGGGSMLLVIGILAALHERQRSDLGQVIDVAMVDGASLLGQVVWNQQLNNEETGTRGHNLLDGGAPFYSVYACADGELVAVGALEAKFYPQLLRGLGLPPDDLPTQYDRNGWPSLRQRFADAFATRTRQEWLAVFESTDACVTPVLAAPDVPQHPHIAARGTVTTADGVPQAMPAPRFSRSRLRPPTEGALNPAPTTVTDVLDGWRGDC